MTCICQPLRVALEGSYMSEEDIIRAAAALSLNTAR